VMAIQIQRRAFRQGDHVHIQALRRPGGSDFARFVD